jgi:T5SS/PEP-CTERM-associated repeat protein
VDVGDSGVATLTIENGGSVTSPTAGIANFAGSAGSSVTVTGTGSTWNISGGFTVGSGDSGSLSILAGGTVNAAGASEINIGPGPLGTGNGVGTLLVDNAKLLASSASLLVGVNGGPGSTMTVQSGGQVITDGGYIGSFLPVGLANNGSGAVTVKGAGSLWDATGGGADNSSKIYIDNPTSMTGLIIQQGGQVIDGSGFVSDFGANNTVNTVTVDGAGSKWTNIVSLSVGYFPPDATFPFGPQASTGAVIITNGGQVSG